MAYTHGGDVYRNKIKYDFSVNINPLGMPQAAIAAAHDGVSVTGAYPDYKAEKLVKAIADKKKIDSGNILLSNGAAELIYLVAAYMAVYHEKGFKALTLAPTFTEYENAIKAYGGIMDYYYLSDENDFDVDEGIINSISEDYKIIFICNPNNPTGRVIEKKLMKRIADKCKADNIILIVDESFIQFLGNESEVTMVGELGSYDNLIVIQAFTKIYGMPGIRLGYGMSCNKELLSRLRAMVQPWNTSIIAQNVGLAAVGDDIFLQKTIENNTIERAFLYKELSAGLADKIIPGCANYLLFKADKCLYDRLIKYGILIRKCDDFEGLSAEYFRVGVRSHSENKILINTWRNEYGNA